MSKKVLLMLLAAGVVACGLAGSASAAVVTFQQGLNGYAGTRDHNLTHQPAWGQEIGQGKSLDLNFNGVPWGGGYGSVLFGFDDIFGTGPGQVAPGTTIPQATLRLYLHTTVLSGYIQIAPMLTPWSEGNTVSWGVGEGDSVAKYRHWRADGVYAPEDHWGDAGEQTLGPVNGVDFHGMWANAQYSPLASRYDWVVDDTGWVEVDVTDTVQAWSDGTIENHGWYGYTSGWWTVARFHSSDYQDDPSLRPMLVIVPEPATLVILGLGGLLALRKRG